MSRIYVNGRVFHRPAGGVRRYAREVAARIDCAVIEPASARFSWSARLWEQSRLPWRTRDGVLLNMAHGAPVLHPRSVLVVHDLFALDNGHEVRPAYASLMRTQLPTLIRRASAVACIFDRDCRTCGRPLRP